MSNWPSAVAAINNYINICRRLGMPLNANAISPKKIPPAVPRRILDCPCFFRDWTSNSACCVSKVTAQKCGLMPIIIWD